MTIKISLKAWSTPLVIFAATLALPAMAADYPENPQWYVGVGGGRSTVEPDKAETGVKTVDDQETAVKLTVGQELTDHLAVEGFLTDLGAARLSNGGRVRYRGYGAGVVLSAPSNSTLFSVYGKGGLTYQDVSASVPVDIPSDIEAYGGLGVEFQDLSGLSLRGEYEYFTTDTQLLSVSLLKRFGGDGLGNIRLQTPVPVISRKPESPATPPQPPIRAAAALTTTSPNDRDGDGITDENDLCPNTPPHAKVNLRGCARFLGVVRGVGFAHDSDHLNAASRRILDRVAANMVHYKDKRFVVVGHTDATEGPDQQRLSLKRALTVARYLVSRGVPASRLRFAGYGARKPRVSNRTEKGRAYNRRIEIYFAPPRRSSRQ